MHHEDAALPVGVLPPGSLRGRGARNAREPVNDDVAPSDDGIPPGMGILHGFPALSNAVDLATALPIWANLQDESVVETAAAQQLVDAAPVALGRAAGAPVPDADRGDHLAGQR